MSTKSGQRQGYIGGDKEAITYSKLEPVAKWYLVGKGASWPVKEEEQALYTGWGKDPADINWVAYPNSTEKRKRGPSANGDSQRVSVVMVQRLRQLQAAPIGEVTFPGFSRQFI